MFLLRLGYYARIADPRVQTYMLSFPHLRPVFMLGIALLAGCAFSQPPAILAPFTTDGCSMFPDRSPLSETDWCTCCVSHDLAYWRGGTAEQRLAADQALRACVLQSSGSVALADLMYNGVRVGGDPNIFTSYRWAYGWPFGRTYEPLTAAEQATAASLAAQYLRTNPARMCTK